MKRARDKSFKDALSKKHLCYVLITCDASASDGQMEVEMSYEGDATLASYLLQGAQNFIDEQENGNDAEALQNCQIYNFK